MMYTKNTCIFCAFVCCERPEICKLYCHGVKKPILGLFPYLNAHKLQVFFVEAYYIITKFTSKLVILLVMLAELHSITCNFCRRFLYA